MNLRCKKLSGFRIAFPPVLFAMAAWFPVPAPCATRYDVDGAPTSRLELERWYINRARFAPEQEADRLKMTNSLPGGNPDYDICEDKTGTNAFGTNAAAWAPWLVSRPPLAPNILLSAACSNHARDMCSVGYITHYSPTSNYYPLGSSPAIRQGIEGYTNLISGYYENVASGTRMSSGTSYPSYGRTPLNIHEALYTDYTDASRGHRQAILNSTAVEMGLGSVRTNWIHTNSWRCTSDYDCQDFGRPSSNHFFTDTLFSDSDFDGLYDEGEGTGGIEIRLWDGTNEAQYYDISEASGSFAVPISDLTKGREIDIELVNTGATARTLTIPVGFNTFGELTLGAGSSSFCGTFFQPGGLTNVGFRNMLPMKSTNMAPSGSNTVLFFRALPGLTYEVQSSENLATNVWVTFTNVVSSNTACSTTDSGQEGRTAPALATQRFYRLRLMRY